MHIVFESADIMTMITDWGTVTTQTLRPCTCTERYSLDRFGGLVGITSGVGPTIRLNAEAIIESLEGGTGPLCDGCALVYNAMVDLVLTTESALGIDKCSCKYPHQDLANGYLGMN